MKKTYWDEGVGCSFELELCNFMNKCIFFIYGGVFETEIEMEVQKIA
jgi:hypothetical protein